MKLFLLENNSNEKNIVDIICNYNNKDIFFINTNCNIDKILNILPLNFDNFADISNENNLLILYNTKIFKVIYRSISKDYIIIIINNLLIIFHSDNKINNKFINIINKLIKLVNLKKIFISKIYLNISLNNNKLILQILINSNIDIKKIE